MDYKYVSYQQPERKKRFGKKRIFFVSVLFLVLLVPGFILYKASNVLTIMGGRASGSTNDAYENFKIEPEDNRIDILLLGIRGAGDENGGLLADTIILVSFDKEKKEAALVSLPRDLFVEMPDYPKREKINFAYALGEEREWGGGGLEMTKQAVQYVSGVYIDHAAVVNFNGFIRVVDLLGGVTVSRNTDFVEALQWQGEGNGTSAYWIKQTAQNSGEDTAEEEQSTDDTADSVDNVEAEPSDAADEHWVFRVPAGTHTLNGQDALYYVRSRFSTSDFDRMHRQQQVISSLRAKVLSLGVLSNPLKVFNLIDALGNNVRTDMGIGEMREALSLAQTYSSAPVRTTSLDVSEESPLKADFIDGQYVIVPKAGDFSEVRTFFKTIFDE